jgi:hypothetical protein
LSGSVVDCSQDKSEITIRQGSEGTARRTVEYTAATQFTVGGAADTAKATPGSADQVAAGNYLTCVGSWDGTKLAASKCTPEGATIQILNDDYSGTGAESLVHWGTAAAHRQ